MTNDIYNKQVELLLQVLPEVAKEQCFALYGGTAINLFYRNMQRLSVDIDLIYVPVEDRSTTLNNISSALEKIKNNLEKIIPRVSIEHKEAIGKLIVSTLNSRIKLEVNLVARGTLSEVSRQILCNVAQEKYGAFVNMPIVPFGQLFGGKICAALDRQHPRDLFDVKLLFENEGFSQDVLTGFLLALISNDRPMYEVLNPNFLDQRKIKKDHFDGMTDTSFTYDDFEATRNQILLQLNSALKIQDKKFLLSVKRLKPDWNIYNFKKFPAVRWKLQNLEKLKMINPIKYQHQLERLESILAIGKAD